MALPLGYYAWKNPILEVLADQLKHDPEWSSKKYTGSSLLDHILRALEEKQLEWPVDFNLLSSNDWIRRMKTNPVFYRDHARDASDMKLYEDLLLNLSANFLKRTFKLIPILDEDIELTLQQNNDSKDPLYICYCNRLRNKNIFISIFPKTKSASKK